MKRHFESFKLQNSLTPKKCLQRERSDKETQRKPPPPFFTGQWPALQLILFHIGGVVIINVMLVVLSSTAKIPSSMCGAIFKRVFYSSCSENYHTVVVVQILVFTQCLATCFSCELNSIAIGAKKIFLVSKYSKKEWLDVQPDQVQNLTPQLVNAGTIKMTYPENKVMMGRKWSKQFLKRMSGKYITVIRYIFRCQP